MFFRLFFLGARTIILKAVRAALSRRGIRSSLKVIKEPLLSHPVEKKFSQVEFKIFAKENKSEPETFIFEFEINFKMTFTNLKVIRS